MKIIAIRVIFFFLVQTVICDAVRADGTFVSCQRTSGYYQFFHFDSLNVPVGKDAVVGDLLGSWASSRNPTAWVCSHRKAHNDKAISMTVQGYPPYTIWGTTQVDGKSYTIYNTTVKAGLGYIVRWRYIIKGVVSEWYPLTIATGGQQTPAQLFPVTDDGNSWNIGVDVQIRFVKTGTSLTSGNTPAFDPIYVRHYQEYEGIISVGSGTYMIADFQSGKLNFFTGGTCTTSDVTVNLPTVSLMKFNNVGYTDARTDFNLKFTKCPAGLSSISYLFTPTSNIIDDSNGVFAMARDSTASGVGIQLLNSQDIPLSFNTRYFLTEYDSDQDNVDYTVPLRIGLYQIEKNVLPGDVRGAVTFTLIYK